MLKQEPIYLKARRDPLKLPSHSEEVHPIWYKLSDSYQVKPSLTLIRESLQVNKHLMTGPKGNSEFCFPETLNVPRGEAEGNIEVEGKQNSLFPEGQSLSVLLYLPTQNRQYTDKNYLLDVGWRTDLPPFQRCTTWSRVSRKFKLLLP